MKPLLVRNSGGRPSCLPRPFCPRLVPSLQPFLSKPFFSIDSLSLSFSSPSPSLVFSFPLSSSYPAFQHPASFPHFFLLPPSCYSFSHWNWLFCNQQGNTDDEKQEKIPASFFISFTSSCAILGCPFFPPISSSKGLLSWTCYQPLWKCQTHICEITTQLCLWWHSRSKKKAKILRKDKIKSSELFRLRNPRYKPLNQLS